MTGTSERIGEPVEPSAHPYERAGFEGPQRQRGTSS